MSSETSTVVEIIKDELLSYDAFKGFEIVDPQGGPVDNEIPVQLNDPFNFDSRRVAPTMTPMDLPRFIQVASDVIKDAQNREGVVASQQITLVADYPAEEMQRLGNEVISWKVISREPARMSADGKSRENRSFNHLYSLRDPKLPNRMITVEYRPLDHVIEFQCWSKSADDGNRLALWLERLFVNHAWAFKVQGADRFYFKNRGIDTFTNPGGQRLYLRPVRFFVRLSDFRIKADSLIRTIAAQITATSLENLNKP